MKVAMLFGNEMRNLSNITSFLVRSQNCEELLLVSSCMSDRPAGWNNSTPTTRVLIKFGIQVFRKYVEKIQFF